MKNSENFAKLVNFGAILKILAKIANLWKIFQKLILAKFQPILSPHFLKQFHFQMSYFRSIKTYFVCHPLKTSELVFLYIFQFSFNCVSIFVRFRWNTYLLTIDFTILIRFWNFFHFLSHFPQLTLNIFIFFHSPKIRDFPISARLESPTKNFPPDLNNMKDKRTRKAKIKRLNLNRTAEVFSRESFASNGRIFRAQTPPAPPPLPPPQILSYSVFLFLKRIRRMLLNNAHTNSKYKKE